MSGRPPWQRRLARLGALAGVAVAIAILLVIKGSPVPSDGSATGPGAEAALDGALAAGQPVLAFFHSESCDSCIQMMAVVDEVYPEYEDDIVLVDVDVYDPRNEALLARARIAGIPTVIVYDRSGEQEWHLGVMGADELRARLAALAGG